MRVRIKLVCATLIALSAAVPIAGERQQDPAAATVEGWSDARIERFLREARIVKTETIRKGVTGATRATLSDGTVTHDAQIQSVEERKEKVGAPGLVETNFEDSWRFNVAAYRLDRLLDLRMVPVSIRRGWRGRPAAYTWWIDDVLMDEGARLKANTAPPDSRAWVEQMQLVQLFDQLIYNIDRNAGNLLIGKTWRVWAIDHTRAFRSHRTLRTPASVTRCDRQVLERLAQLDRSTLEREMEGLITGYQLTGLMARRDLIVEALRHAGPAALFERGAMIAGG